MMTSENQRPETKADYAAYLTAVGLVVEGDEKKDELVEAYRHHRAWAKAQDEKDG